jgi:hypothetical protein
MVGAESLLSKPLTIGHRDGVIDRTRVNLFHSGLILEALSVFLDVLWSSWSILVLVKVSLETVFGVFIGPKGDNLAGCTEVGVFETRGGCC